MRRAYQLVVCAALLALAPPGPTRAGGATPHGDDSDRSRSRERTAPGPELGPSDVVRLQLEALRHNDASDRGIAAAFRFASPENRANTGPLPRFARMIRDGPYAVMLRYEAATYGAVVIRGGEALQRVTLVAPGEVATFLFLLSRQTKGECAGCWLTDSVLLEPRAEDRT